MREGSIGFRSDPLEDALRSERLRLERQRQHARELAVFFQVSARRAAPATSGQTGTDLEGTETVERSGEPAAHTSPDIDLGRDQGQQCQKEDFLAGCSTAKSTAATRCRSRCRLTRRWRARSSPAPC